MGSRKLVERPMPEKNSGPTRNRVSVLNKRHRERRPHLQVIISDYGIPVTLPKDADAVLEVTERSR